MSDYTPTTEQIREGYAQDPVAEYHDPLTNHAAHNRRVFDRWFAEEIRTAKAECRKQIADDIRYAIDHDEDLGEWVEEFEAGMVYAIRIAEGTL